MGLLDYFSGAGQANRIKEGAFLNVDHLNKGRDLAFQDMQTGLDKYQPIASQGRDEARDTIGDGYQYAQDAANFHAIAARDALNNQTGLALGNIRDGAAGAQGYLGGALQRVTDLYNPYIQQGNQASELYSQLIGGGQGAADVYDNYYDPTRDFRNEQIQRAMDARANAQGYGGSGRAGLATARALNESQYGDMQNYANRLERASNTGGQYASGLAGLSANIMGQQANTAMQEGSQLAGYNSGLGSSLANLGLQHGQYLGGLHMGAATPTAAYTSSAFNDLAGKTHQMYDNRASLNQGTEAAIGSIYNKMHQGIGAAKAAGASNVIGGISGLAKTFGGGLFG